MPLRFKKPLRFSFIVFPEGKEFGAALGLLIERGICDASLSLDDDYPLALQIDEHLFADGFCSAETIGRKVGLMHELAHIVHGAYFQNMGCLGEGFAELLPHYLLDLDIYNECHCQAVLNLTESDMQSLDFIHQRGMFALEKPGASNTQEQKSYLSVYLWMLAYVQRLETRLKADKFAAVNFMLEAFETADRLNFREKMQVVADLAGVSNKQCFSTLELQQEGQAYLR